MARIILALCLLISSVVSAQPGYTNINARYKWIAGGFDSSLILPRYGGVPSGLRSAWNTDGQLAVDTANNHLYVYSGGAWVRVANYSDIGSSYTFPYSVKDVSGAVQLENDTTANPANYFYGRNSAGRRGWYPQSGITGVNIYNSNGQATANRVFIGNGKTLNFNNFVGVTFDTSKVTIRTSTGFDAVGDSSFNVFNGGIHTSRGVRHDNLPYTLNITGKKISVIDTANGGTMYTIDPALIGGGGSGTVTSVATNNGTGITGGTITGSGTLAIDTANTIATRLQLQHRIDSLVGAMAQVDTTGIATGDFLKWDGTKFIKQTPNWITDLRYSNDSVYKTVNGTESLDFVLPSGGGLDSIVVVAYDSLSTSNVWINSTTKRMGYRVDSFYYHLAITDSVRYIQPAGYDEDAQAYFDAITGAGGSLTTPQMDAMNDFVLELKAASIWSGTFDFIHFLVGGSEAAVKFNLVDPVDNDANYRLTFPNSATFASTGVTTNGSNQYINTHDILRNATYADSANYHIAAFNRTTAGVAGFTWGLNDGASSTMYGLCRSTDDKSYVKQPNGSEGNFTDATTGKGFYLVHTRAATVNVEAYKDGVQKIANANNGNGQLMPATYKLLFNAYNNVGTITQYRAGELVLISSGRGFSDTERANYETAVANFITALSL